MFKIIAAALILAPLGARADDVKRVSGDDLAIQTHKWDGKTIETSGFCFYADVDDFRCLTGVRSSAARIDFANLEPDAARKKIEDNCDTVAKASNKACVVRFRFVYDGYATQQVGMTIVRIVKAKDDSGVIVGK